MQGRELTEWEELAGGYAVFCHCLYQPTKEKYFQKAEDGCRMSVSRCMLRWKETVCWV